MSIPATNTSDAEMAQPSQAELVCALPHIPDAVSVVRRQARTVLTQWRVPAPTADDALLVISELTTNAIVHALPPAVLRLPLPEVGGRRAVRIEVTDSGPAPRRRPSHDSPDPAEHRENGRGTDIVAALSARRGISLHPERTTRWAVLHMRA
ncbi:anti-sigma regulatory factor (Ser/Thr protein kinase) [Streptomyces umbrinus]|uniref:Anti-sigma regulatory factor (Ser/Thr protein kinase) n=1 Tax=Streptomyces umbrinus TaxID=67370 RepID=A0ABU0SU10_9ACTN|nr:ATP-binding protein [Streptomyces umbrinus]MDQ1027047.1 anti-sigma regulatory factor (Ser/Thr protein kinase) [Streptomyces umbrinus]